MINGTQNTNPGFLPVQYEDYSTASFYRVKVTGGENKIRLLEILINENCNLINIKLNE